MKWHFASNDWKAMNNEMERMWKKAVVAEFQALRLGVQKFSKNLQSSQNYKRQKGYEKGSISKTKKY
jgi:uncharacterized protein YggL (DUF469 family)